MVAAFYLNTQLLTKEENIILIKFLTARFNLDCTIQKIEINIEFI